MIERTLVFGEAVRARAIQSRVERSIQSRAFVEALSKQPENELTMSERACEKERERERAS